MIRTTTLSWLAGALLLLPVLTATAVSTALPMVPLARSAWRLEGGKGAWVARGADGPLLSVRGTGEDVTTWSASVPALTPGHLYRLSFDARVMPGSSVSTVTAGPVGVNRDFSVTEQAAAYSYVFQEPAGRPKELRLGQWHLRGEVLFSHVRLTPVAPLYEGNGADSLGEGETVRNGEYRFRSPLMGEGANSSHPLQSFTAGFNSDRWLIGLGDEVIYRFSAAGGARSGASVAANVGYYERGACEVAVSRDGVIWSVLGRLAQSGTITLPVPDALLPAPAIWVRVKGSATPESSAAVSLQVNSLSFRSGARSANVSESGSTAFVEIERQTPGLGFSLTALAARGASGGRAVQGVARGGAGANGNVRLELALVRKNEPTQVSRAVISLTPAGTRFTLPYLSPGSGLTRYQLKAMRADGSLLYAASATRYLSSYEVGATGHAVARLPQGDLWWCIATAKVAPTQPAPGPARAGAAA